MTTKTDQLAAFEQYFLVEHSLDITIKQLPDNYELPTLSEFEKSLPESFLMSSELSKLSMKALLPLRGLSEHAEQLMEYLELQSKKIDLMMHHLLKQDVKSGETHQTTAFGGGGVIINTENAMTIGALVELQAFISSESAAIFSIGRVIQCEYQAGTYAVKILFERIRPDDLDIIIRGALNVQAEELKLRRQQRDQES